MINDPVEHYRHNLHPQSDPLLSVQLLIKYSSLQGGEYPAKLHSSTFPVMIVNRLLARQIKHLIRYNLHSPARRRDKSNCTGIKLHGRTSPCLSSHSELDLLCSQACCFTDLPMSGGAERKQNDPEMFFDGASEHGDFTRREQSEQRAKEDVEN